MTITYSDRNQGCLLGLAVGDAVGTTLEFKARGSFTPITDMVGGGPFNLEAGQWTDDTSMALCLAHSLIYSKGFDPIDQMNRYYNWWQFGYMSSNGRCFDIGLTVSQALEQYLKNKEPYAGSSDPYSAGNGSLMRLAPVVLYYAHDVEKLKKYAMLSSRTTHSAEECIDACAYFSFVLKAALDGKSKKEVLRDSTYLPATDKIKEISTGFYLEKSIDEIQGTGYVIASLEAALWCFAHSDSFDEAILKAANLGDDADTTAAICGQIAGAYYGRLGIPKKWLEKLTMTEEIQSLAIALTV